MRLKELREEKRLTQKELAKALGLKRTRIAAYETGVNNPEYAVPAAAGRLFPCDARLSHRPVGYARGDADRRGKPNPPAPAPPVARGAGRAAAPSGGDAGAAVAISRNRPGGPGAAAPFYMDVG